MAQGCSKTTVPFLRTLPVGISTSRRLTKASKTYFGVNLPHHLAIELNSPTINRDVTTCLYMTQSSNTTA